jgi:hypothetical protein
MQTRTVAADSGGDEAAEPVGAHAVCVAINDNHRAWYEMLVPFILSLRRTDFAGRLIVLSYGLSAQKREILRREGIEFVEADPSLGLPVGRFVEAARLCARDPEIAKLALYDADIWFCGERFDLFTHVTGAKLHVAPDPLFCSFVVAPIIGPQRDRLWREAVDEVKARHGGALQAGLTAGTREAWAGFSDHVAGCLPGIGVDFQNCFGIDTTFLHLWAAKDGVALLSETQNFIIKSGLQEIYEEATGVTRLTHLGEDIRALHMAGDIRFLNRWRYYANDAAHALEAGRAFALAPDDVRDPVGFSDEVAQHFADLGLALSGVRMERFEGAHLQIMKTPDDVTIFGAGNHEITFTATHAIPRLNTYMSHPSGFPSPIRWSLSVDGQTASNSNQLLSHFSHPVEAGAAVVLKAESLGGQLCKVIWTLTTSAEIQQ